MYSTAKIKTICNYYVTVKSLSQKFTVGLPGVRGAGRGASLQARWAARTLAATARHKPQKEDQGKDQETKSGGGRQRFSARNGSEKGKDQARDFSTTNQLGEEKRRCLAPLSQLLPPGAPSAGSGLSNVTREAPSPWFLFCFAF